MNIALIIFFILSSISCLIGFACLINIKRFNTIDDNVDIKKNFKRCFDIPCVIGIVQLLLFIAIFITIFAECLTTQVLNTGSYWTFAFIVGLIIGIVIGEIYYRKFKKPFFIKNFPDEYNKYLEESRPARFKKASYYRESANNFLFFAPISSLLTIIAVILTLVNKGLI